MKVLEKLVTLLSRLHDFVVECDVLPVNKLMWEETRTVSFPDVAQLLSVILILWWDGMLWCRKPANVATPFKWLILNFKRPSIKYLQEFISLTIFQHKNVVHDVVTKDVFAFRSVQELLILSVKVENVCM